MLIYLGADHGGFNLKERVKNFLLEQGYEVDDLGNAAYDSADDYPDFGAAVAEAVSKDPEGSRGILFCRSGVGMDVVANKFPRVRAALGISPDHVYSARHDDDVNVLSLAADFIEDPPYAEKMIEVFLSTPFGAEERYKRRLKKIADAEEGLRE